MIQWRVVSKGVDVLVYRITHDGRIMSSKPCTQCAQLLFNNECIIKRVYWSTEDGTLTHQTPYNLYYHTEHRHSSGHNWKNQ